MRIIIITIFCLFLVGSGHMALSQSQIIDDSTKQIYGAYTTYYQTYDDILNNRDYKHKVDSTLGHLHQFNEVQKSHYKYQSLGNLGTALHPVFYNLPTQVGIRSGYDAYTPYYTTASDIEYYDTRSPYTPLDVVLGGRGRTVTDVRHTRNINPTWNAGGYYHKINADKQIASAGKNDNQSTMLKYLLHMDYKSKNDKYRGLMSLSRFNQKVFEQGGIRIPAGDPLNAYFDENADVYLNEAQSQDYRLGYHLYNHYQLEPELQVYQSMELIQNKNFFTDNPLSTDKEFYEQFDYDILINPDSTTDQSQTNQFINEFGIKGDYTKMFYRFFVKFRNVKYRSNYIPGEKLFFESSGGGELRYDFDSLQNIRASAEYLLGGYYRFGGTYFNKFFTVEYWRTQSRPAIIEENYLGNHFEWSNNFSSPASDMLKGSLIYGNKFFRIEPFASLINVKNNIYYGYDKAPAQAEGSAQLLSFGLNLNLNFGKNIHWENQGIYTGITGDTEAMDALRIPELFINSRLYYGSYWFDEKIYMMFGVDAHYKSDYYAPAYNPVIQQFYLQNDFVIPSYLLMNAFLEFQIGTLSMFIQFENLTQPPSSGYFTYPYYTGQSRILEVGIRWQFFN